MIFVLERRATRDTGIGLTVLAWFVFFLQLSVLCAVADQPASLAAEAPGCTESVHVETSGSHPSSPSVEQQAADSHYERGLSFSARGDTVGAEQEFKAAVAALPRQGAYVRRLANLYIALNRYDEALNVIRVYTTLCGATPLGYALEADLLFHQKKYDLAYLAAQDSLSLSDRDPRVHELLGLIYLLKGQNPAASLELKKAVDLDPNQPQTRFYFGRSLYSLGQYPEARDQFLACLRIQPEYRKAYENLGLCYEGLGDYSQATQAFQKAIALEKDQPGPKHGEPFGFYGAMLIKLDQPEKAVEVLRQGVALSPKSFIVNLELGKALLNLRRLEEAETYLLIAKGLAPNYPRTYFFLGKVHQQQHRLKEAEQEMATFRQLNKGAESIGFPITDR